MPTARAAKWTDHPGDANNVPLLQLGHTTHGRTDAPLLPKGEITVGTYDLVFQIGRYFSNTAPASDHPFIDVEPIRFGIDDAEAHDHVPLLASPFSYSTYRGS